MSNHKPPRPESIENSVFSTVWTSDACRFVVHMKINNSVMHLRLVDKYSGGRRNCNAGVTQMMTYKVSTEYTSYTE